MLQTEIKVAAKRIKSSEQGARGEDLYFRTDYETNSHNPIRGYEGLGKIIAKGGKRNIAWLGLTSSQSVGFKVSDADEILVLIKIRPLLKAECQNSNLDELKKALDALPSDYGTLLARHEKLHGDLMGRVSFSLNAPAADRAKPTEELNQVSRTMEAPLAQIERVFEAGRYHVICSTGYNPPNLQGLWSATLLAPWNGDFHSNGDLASSIAFLSMGNTPDNHR